MRNRRLLWCLGAGAFLLLAGFALFVVVHVLPDRVTPENCARIEIGLTTAEEVEALLGGPADMEFPGGPAPLGVDPVANAAWERVWVGERWAACYQFDALGRVLAGGCSETAEAIRDQYGLPAPSFWQKLRRSLGW
jgi:hypothetical protein